LAARALHAASPRATGPFVALNCAALPDSLAEGELFGVERGAYTGADRSRQGAFARADGGTLLLDEVGELSLATQAKLLRVLETGEVRPVGGRQSTRVDVRVVTATWRDLVREVEAERFRFDLLQRLHVLRVTLPPLRERPRDVAPLLEACLMAEGLAGGWPDEGTVRLLESAPWQGNVRQLRSAVARFATFGDPGALAAAAFGGRVPAHRGPDVGRVALRQTLAKHHGNRAAAARDLGISRSTLYRWLGRTG
jgi:DNA-binding NtrC family response regulator